MNTIIENLENLQEKIIRSKLAEEITIEEIQSLVTAKKYLKSMEELHKNVMEVKDNE